MGEHLIDGEFQSDKYPTTPRGKVPLSVKDTTAQDLLWEYAQRRRPVDASFSADLEAALLAAGYAPSTVRPSADCNCHSGGCGCEGPCPVHGGTLRTGSADDDMHEISTCDHDRPINGPCADCDAWNAEQERKRSSRQAERVATPGENQTGLISVAWWKPGYHIELPYVAVTRKTGSTGVTLTRDEAFDLLDKLRRTLASDSVSKADR